MLLRTVIPSCAIEQICTGHFVNASGQMDVALGRGNQLELVSGETLVSLSRQACFGSIVELKTYSVSSHATLQHDQVIDVCT